METIAGTVEEIIFYNEDNGYCVAEIDCKGELITIVGTMHCLTPGESVTLQGDYKNHPVYGEQFSVLSFEKTAPDSIDAIYKYLASGMIKGVREGTAKKIIDTFAEDSLRIIENEPERLAEIKGISIKKAYEINSEYILQFGIRSLVMFFQQYDISSAYAVKAYKALGNDAINKIKANPFILTKKVKGMGFKTVDKIASRMGIDPLDPERIKAAIKYILLEYSSIGNTYTLQSNVEYSAKRLLSCDIDIIKYAINDLIYEKEIVCEKKEDDNALYLISMHISECNCAYRLKMLNSTYPLPITDEIKNLIQKIESNLNIKLEEKQKQAVIYSLTMPILVITGGPGTGKTTVINTIIKALEHQGKSVVLTAPTGRAAKRMTEVTNKEAKTIHRLLELGYSPDDEKRFEKDESNPIEADTIIVDEMSMVDIQLFNSLLKAIKKGTRLILVGDADQLPSIGPGNVLRDIIASDAVAVVKLTEIFRQAQESLIVTNAHRVNSGKNPIVNNKDGDFFIIQKNTAQEITETITQLCINRLPKAYGVNPFYDIQILTPTRKGPVGVNVLNTHLQEELNPPSPKKNEKQTSDCIFREFDKVMQIKNNYDISWETDDDEGLGLFNGDIGCIKSINDEFDNMTITFDETKSVSYPYPYLADLELAYASTIHKSQGSEFPVVIIPLYPTSQSLLTRNLLYTAITRAKKLVILVGQANVLDTMIKNDKEVKRCTGLKERLLYQ